MLKNSLIILVLALLSGCSLFQKSKIRKPTWEENFNGNRLDLSKWSKIPRGTPDWKKHMSDWDSLYEVKNGMLILRGMENSGRIKSDTAAYITGGVFTKDKVDFGYGRLEIRAKFQNAQGAWPAIWMLAQDRKYPGGGEIDIMEHLNHDDIVYQTVHSYYTITLNQKENPPHGGTTKINPKEFNTYAVEKHPDSLVFFVNDKRTFSYPRIKTNQPEQFPFSEGKHYLLIDMQLGGGWVGKIDPQQLPVEMQIDWVKFYKF